MKPTAIALLLALTACGTAPALQEPASVLTTDASVFATDTPVEPEQRSTSAHPVAIGAAKGAGRGAVACAMPLAVFSQGGGPIGFVVGGVITLYCLPFGIVGGALIGGISAAAPIDHSNSFATANAASGNQAFTSLEPQAK